MITFNGSFSQEDLNATLQGLGRDIFFVQIGAMDGVTHDPIHDFVKRLGWRGLLVEPIPYLNRKLQENYTGCDGLLFAETAVADFDGRIEMAFLDPGKVAEGIFSAGAFGTSSLMQDRGVLAGKGVPDYVAEAFQPNIQHMEVACCRLKTLLAVHKVTAIDLLVVDAEGADWMIARQLDLELFQPRMVYLEYYHLPAYEKTACAAHFSNHGYAIYLDKDRGANFLAVKR